MIKGTLKSGFNFEYDESCIDDMRFLEDLSKVGDNALLVPGLVEKMLGKEQKEALYKHLEDENGRVPTLAFMDAFNEIMEKSPKSKN